jgi:chemotaxis signal transduction protein
MSLEQYPRQQHQSAQRINGAGSASDDEQQIETTLRRRSRDLAARQLTPASRQVHEEVIVARRAEVLLAAPITTASEVRFVAVVEVPGSGDVISGLFQIRSRVYSLIDLAPFFGESERLNHGQQSMVLVVSGTPGAVGLRIDEIIGQRSILSNEIDQGLQEQSLSFVSAVTKDLVHILDVEALMASSAVRQDAGGR